jgi:histidinol-phosphate aminotransferase
MFNPSELVHPYINKLGVYPTANRVSATESELPITLLASNENPYPPSPKILPKLTECFTHFNRYPDPTGTDLKIQIAEHLGVDPPQIFLGNGSSEILALVVQILTGTGDEVVVSEFVYALFETYINAANATLIKAPGKNWGHDLSAMAARVTAKTKLVIIANPNNPTGTYVTHQELKTFLTQLPDNILVLLDEAYYDYADNEDFPDALSLLQEFPNLLVTRTFSKAYALAGLRIGYSIADPRINDFMNRVRLPFNLNSCALAAASVALEDQAYLQNTLQLIREEKKFIAAALTKLKLSYLPSAANYFAIQFKDTNVVFKKLLNQGVLVRQLNNYAMPNHLRVTIGTHGQNLLFLNSLADIMAEEFVLADQAL